MNAVQENKFGMYLSVELVMNESADVWANSAGIDIAVNELAAVISGIEAHRLVQERGTIGITMDKAALRSRMSDLTVAIGNGLAARATFMGDHEVAEMMKVTRSGLDKLRDTTVATKCKMIHVEALESVGLLSDYGLTVDMVHELGLTIARYRSSIAKPRSGIGEGVDATLGLADLFSKGDFLLKEKLDRMMEVYQLTNVSLYNRYHSARRIVNNRTGGGGADGNTSDSPPVE